MFPILAHCLQCLLHIYSLDFIFMLLRHGSRSLVSDFLQLHGLGIFQVRILEWAAFPFSRGSSQPRDGTQVSCIAGRFFTIWATREAHELLGKMNEPKTLGINAWMEQCMNGWRKGWKKKSHVRKQVPKWTMVGWADERIHTGIEGMNQGIN